MSRFGVCSARISGDTAGADPGGVCWARTNPLFIDLFDLLVLIVTYSVFDTQRLRASPVWLLYNLRPIARIDIAIGVFGEVSNQSNISKGGAILRIGVAFHAFSQTDEPPI